MKSAVGIEQAGSPGMGTGELDGSLNAFAARAGKKYFGQPASGALAKTLRQFPRQFWNVALQHHRATLLQFINDSGQYVGMIVSHIVNTVPGKKIENATAVRCEQLGSQAPFIADGEVKYFEQLLPLRIHVLGVETIGRNVFCKRHSHPQSIG